MMMAPVAEKRVEGKNLALSSEKKKKEIQWELAVDVFRRGITAPLFACQVVQQISQAGFSTPLSQEVKGERYLLFELYTLVGIRGLFSGTLASVIRQIILSSSRLLPIHIPKPLVQLVSYPLNTCSTLLLLYPPSISTQFATPLTLSLPGLLYLFNLHHSTFSWLFSGILTDLITPKDLIRRPLERLFSPLITFSPIFTLVPAFLAHVLAYPVDTIIRCQHVSQLDMFDTISLISKRDGNRGFYGGFKYYIASWVISSVCRAILIEEVKNDNLREILISIEYLVGIWFGLVT